jgi:hypothetical protein
MSNVVGPGPNRPTEGINTVRLSFLGRALPVLPVTAFVCLVAAAPAAAGPVTAAADQLTCQISADLAFEPALGEEPQDSTATGSNGTATCAGTIDGEAVTADVPGTIEVSSTLSQASCYGSAGSGVFTLALTTVTGAAKSVSGTVDFAVAGFEVQASGDLTGTGSITPTVGDCIEAPISQVAIAFSEAVVTVAPPAE